MTPRRKCLLIALAAVLPLSAGFWWMTRPVIDPRLVGTWKCERPELGMFRLVLRQDGTGETQFEFTTGPLYWDGPRGIRFGGLDARLDDIVESRFGNRPRHTMRLLMEPVDANRVKLNAPGAQFVAMYIRVPD